MDDRLTEKFDELDRGFGVANNAREAGSGRGNWGHKGRPGQIGGSSSSFSNWERRNEQHAQALKGKPSPRRTLSPSEVKTLFDKFQASNLQGKTFVTVGHGGHWLAKGEKWEKGKPQWVSVMGTPAAGKITVTTYFPDPGDSSSMAKWVADYLKDFEVQPSDVEVDGDTANVYFNTHE